MARFRSGTLERSVKRWGPRMPSAKIKRVGHSWKYVILEDEPVGMTGAGSLQVTVVDSNDWIPATGNGLGCKNVVLEAAVSLSWTPETDASTVFNAGMMLYGVFIRDQDETTSPPIESCFDDARALKWGMYAKHFNGMNDGAGLVSIPELRMWQFRFKCRARYLKFDEELRFAIGVTSDLSDVFLDLRCHMFGRCSWETP